LKINPMIALEKRALIQISAFHLRQPPHRAFARLGWAIRCIVAEPRAWPCLTVSRG
jgi:hypothetical protein